MSITLGKVFDHAGVKRVTKTDKRKGAYVLTAWQASALESAGITPARGVVFRITILADPCISSVEASYYHAERSDQAGRVPEPRLGREIIRSWMDMGDEVVIGNIGGQVFAMKLLGDQGLNPQALLEEVVRVAHTATVMGRAKKAVGKPERKEVVRQDFVRDPFVVKAALIRASGACEMPGCRNPLFSKDDGTLYLEVHHIVPLGEDGDDTLVNVAALCPHCHRELHFGRRRLDRRADLLTRIASIEK